MDKEIIERYVGGDSTVKIASDLGKTLGAVDWALKRNGVKRRTPREAALLAIEKGRVKNGAGHPLWKGGMFISHLGYKTFSTGPHKNRHLHTVIMEEKIGRRIRKGEVVHHINGIKTDNRIENLKLMSSSEHSKLHSKKGIRLSKETKMRMSKADRSLTSGKNHYGWIEVPLEKLIFALGKFKTRKEVAKYLNISGWTLKEKMVYHGIYEKYKKQTSKDMALGDIIKAINCTNCITNAAKKLSTNTTMIKNKLKKLNTTYEEIKNGK